MTNSWETSCEGYSMLLCLHPDFGPVIPTTLAFIDLFARFHSPPSRRLARRQAFHYSTGAESV